MRFAKAVRMIRLAEGFGQLMDLGKEFGVSAFFGQCVRSLDFFESILPALCHRQSHRQKRSGHGFTVKMFEPRRR